MYVPKPYQVKDLNQIKAAIREIGLATLVSVDSDGRPMATHTPLEIVEGDELILEGHIAKLNPQWNSFDAHPDVKAIFLSPVHHYISSSWYSIPEVPTWNYVSIHLSGALDMIEDSQELWSLLQRLTYKYEASMERPLDLDKLPKHVTNQINGIKGFLIKVDKIDASFKMSQTRLAKDHLEIICQLRKSGNVISNLMADKMEEIGHI